MVPSKPALTRTAGVLALVAAAALSAACGDEPGGHALLGPETGANSGAATGLPSAEVRQRTEVYEFGDFGLYVPANVQRVRGIILTLGGPNTKAFVTGEPTGAPIPEVEASLQALGGMLRDLAADRGLAILGASLFGPTAMSNSSASDQLLLDAVAQAAAVSGRSGFLDAPFILYGLSGGAPELSGFAARHPGRVAGLFLKVPAEIEPQVTAAARDVPTYVVLAELDAFIDNPAMTSAFLAHRAAGAPWALAMESGVVHHSLTPVQRELTVNWMRRILVPSGGPGWLGDPATGRIAPVAAFRGDHATASWFPTRALAEEWAAFIGL